MTFPREAIVWWEKRRIPFNLIVFVTGVVTVTVVVKITAPTDQSGGGGMGAFGLLVAIVIFGLSANFFYTLGWITEALWIGADSSRAQKIRPKIFWLGVAFSIFVTLLPVLAVLLLWALRGFK